MVVYILLGVTVSIFSRADLRTYCTYMLQHAWLQVEVELRMYDHPVELVYDRHDSTLLHLPHQVSLQHNVHFNELG